MCSMQLKMGHFGHILLFILFYFTSVLIELSLQKFHLFSHLLLQPTAFPKWNSPRLKPATIVHVFVIQANYLESVKL